MACGDAVWPGLGRRKGNAGWDSTCWCPCWVIVLLSQIISWLSVEAGLYLLVSVTQRDFFKNAENNQLALRLENIMLKIKQPIRLKLTKSESQTSFSKSEWSIVVVQKDEVIGIAWIVSIIFRQIKCLKKFTLEFSRAGRRYHTSKIQTSSFRSWRNSSQQIQNQKYYKNTRGPFSQAWKLKGLQKGLLYFSEEDNIADLQLH